MVDLIKSTIFMLGQDMLASFRWTFELLVQFNFILEKLKDSCIFLQECDTCQCNREVKDNSLCTLDQLSPQPSPPPPTTYTHTKKKKGFIQAKWTNMDNKVSYNNSTCSELRDSGHSLGWVHHVASGNWNRLQGCVVCVHLFCSVIFKTLWSKETLVIHVDSCFSSRQLFTT